MTTPPFAVAARLWAWIGLSSFGGPVAQIGLMHEEVVERRRWVDERSFLHALRLCNALPGPEAQQLACYLGYRTHGLRGAFASGLLFILPGLSLITLLGWLYMAYGETAIVSGAVRTLGGAVVALIAAAASRIGARVVRTRWAVALAVLAAVALFAGAPFPIVIVMGALLGILIGRVRPTALVPLEDQEDPGPPGDAIPRHLLLRRTVIGLVLWLVPIALLLSVGGVVAELTGLFTIASLLTFGGAYAIMAYVATVAVDDYGWLTGKQMAAGFALGETTPGPLILINSFIGFVAGWQAIGGIGGGLAGAGAATFATFAPSFFLILVGAPLVDRVPTRGPIADALAALQGVVAGAVVVLGVFIARATLLPPGSIDLLAIAIAVIVFVLQRRGVSIPLMVVVVALLGALLGLTAPEFGLVGWLWTYTVRASDVRTV